MYVNPLAVQKVAAEFLENLFDDLEYEEKQSLYRILINYPYRFMIERIIANKTIIFDHKTPYLDSNKEIFQKIKAISSPLRPLKLRSVMMKSVI